MLKQDLPPTISARGRRRGPLADRRAGGRHHQRHQAAQPVRPGLHVAVLVGLSMPVFVIGELLILFVFVPLNQHGFTWIQTGYAGISQGVVTWAGHMILPWITLAAVQAAVYTRLTRGQLLDTLGEDYIRTARAKGLSERPGDLGHGVRAALTPVVSQLGVDFGQLLGGVVVVEAVFGLGGLGQVSVQAIDTDDLPVIIGFVSSPPCSWWSPTSSSTWSTRCSTPGPDRLSAVDRPSTVRSSGSPRPSSCGGSGSPSWWRTSPTSRSRARRPGRDRGLGDPGGGHRAGLRAGAAAAGHRRAIRPDDRQPVPRPPRALGGHHRGGYRRLVGAFAAGRPAPEQRGRQFHFLLGALHLRPDQARQGRPRPRRSWLPFAAWRARRGDRPRGGPPPARRGEIPGFAPASRRPSPPAWTPARPRCMPGPNIPAPNIPAR